LDALTAIAARHSTRHFSTEPLAREQLETIVNAGCSGPSARGERPWTFVVVTKADARKRLAELTEGGGSFIAEAPACVAVFCKSTKYYLEDGCVAAQNMLVAATALGIQSCWVAGDKKPYASAVANLLFAPEGTKLVALIVLGHAAEGGQAQPKPALGEVLRWERF